MKILYKKNYVDNQDRLLRKQKLYDKQRRDKINTRLKEYIRRRRDSDLDFKLACNLRNRLYTAFKTQNVRKTNETYDLLECSHSFFQRWVIHQLCGIMNIKNYGSAWQIVHCLPIATFNLLDENEKKKCFNCINLRPIYVKDNTTKGDEIDYQLYLLQEVKAKNFLKLNSWEGFNQDLFWRNI